ncbi:MAG: glgB [Acidimicrobiia bacterium]|nr:glgB [Acidimicrobiia bacterium]
MQAMATPWIGDVDLYLFGEGRHRKLWDLLGAHLEDSGGASGRLHVAVWAPNARRVSVVGDWNNWDGRVDRLEPVAASGIWAGVVETGVEVGHRYKFELETAHGALVLKSDPMAQATEHPPDTASVVTKSHHVWGDEAWLQARASVDPARRPMRIYELHLASWRPGVPTRELAHELAEYVAEIGFTHVELMPVMEHPFGGSWGYQVSGYYAPTARLGVPDDLRYLIDVLHQANIGVILDWVPAHFPKDQWALARFDGTALYEHADPRLGEHPDWGTHVFNYGRHEVRNFLIANALYWIEEFHADGLRVDAVASMLYRDYSREADQWVPNQFGGRENLEAIQFLKELNTIVFAEHPDAVMVAEESTSWPGVTHPVEQGGLGFSHKWNMGWMHDTLEYLKRDPAHRRWHHHELTFGLLYAFTERFSLPLSHDEVVHGKGPLLDKMSGDHWQRMANLRCLYGWMWAYPGSPLLFMGSELAQPHEWSADLGVEWGMLDHAENRGVVSLVQHLNEQSVQWPAVWARDSEPGGFQWLEADDAHHSTYAFLRWDDHGHSAVACIANFTPVPRDDYRVGLPWPGEWTVVCDTDRRAFGGSGYADEQAAVTADSIPWHRQPASAVVTVPPLAVVWLARRGSA